MITKNVLAKGQIVIPKTIRDLMGINVGDEIVMDVDDKKIILTKKESVKNIFSEVSKRKLKNISMKEIKKELETRYEGD